MSKKLSQKIKEWLNGGEDWHTGRTLYADNGANKRLLGLFDLKGPTPYNTAKLRVELTKLMDNPPKPKPKPVKKAATPNTPVNTFTDNPQPTRVKDWHPDLLAQVQPLMDEQRFLHRTKLLETTTKAERGEAAKLILEIGDKIRVLERHQKDYETTGKLPEAAQPIPEAPPTLDPNKLQKQLNNARSNVSRYKGVKGKEHLYKKWKTTAKELETELKKYE